MTKLMLTFLVLLYLLFIPMLMADEAEDSIAAKVDDLFMKASSGEVQFRDLVEPAKEELIEMGEKAVPRMITKLKTEDARERHTVEDIFKKIGDPAVPYLIEALNTDNLYQLRLASSCLGKIGNDSATGHLLKLFNHTEHTVRSSAVTAVGDIGDTMAVDEVIEILGDQAETVRKSAAVSLGKIGHPAAIETLIKALDDSHFSVRYSAAGSLVKIGGQAGETLLDKHDRLSSNALYYALDVWAALKYKRAFKSLKEFLKSEDRRLRGFTMIAMAQIDPQKAKKIVTKHKSEDDIFIRSCRQKASDIISKAEAENEH
jgi:HEAT repeat protein